MGQVEDAVRRDLRALTSKNRLSSLGGRERTVLALAKHLDDPLLPARDAAAVARELRIALAELRKTAPSTVRSGIDELRDRRETRKRATGGAAP